MLVFFAVVAIFLAYDHNIALVHSAFLFVLSIAEISFSHICFVFFGIFILHFSASIIIMPLLYWSYGLDEVIISMHIASVFEDTTDNFESLSNEEIVNLLSDCIKEDYKTLS